MNKKLTIYDIKYLTEQTEPYFFSRNTMRFFHQTMKDFKVKYSPTGRVFIISPMFDSSHRHVGYTAREFNQETNKLDRVDYERSYNPSLEYFSIQSYINQH